jgi:glutamine amidotransferase
METVAIVDCGSGNLKSAAKAFERAALESGRGFSIDVTSDPEIVRRADRVALPGQGAFAAVLAGVAAVPGLREALEEVAIVKARPFFGICVGMQLMAERGLEHTVTAGFGWIKGDVAEMPAPGLRLPQMGWNGLDFTPGNHPLLDGLEPGDHVYFVHSYALVHGAPEETIATTDYGGAVPAIVVAGNRAGTQFHVEKSQDAGLRLLGNFLRWRP